MSYYSSYPKYLRYGLSAVHAASQLANVYRTVTSSSRAPSAYGVGSKPRSRVGARGGGRRSYRPIRRRVVSRRKIAPRKGKYRGRRRLGGKRESFAKRVMKVTVPIQIYNSQLSEQITSLPNQCGYFISSGSLHTAADYSNMFGIPALSTSTNSTSIDIESAKMTAILVNQDTAQVEITAYLCMPRHDLPNSAGVTPFQSLTAGFITNGLTSTTPSSTLFQSKDFTECYKIVRTDKRILAPGQEWNLMCPGKPRIVNKIWSNISSAYNYRGFTKFWVFRIQGQVCNDSVTKSAVGFSGSKVDAIVTENYSFRYITPLNTQYASVVGLGTVNLAEFINPDTDAVITESTA